MSEEMIREEMIITVQNVVKAYRLGSGESLSVLDKVSYEFPRGRLIMIMGRSGSGKTTLMNLLSTLDEATDGELLFYGDREYRYSKMSVREKERLRRFHMGFVFQSVALIPVMTARENIEFGMRTAGIRDGREKRIAEVLESVGLSDRAKHYPAELSGGERQRIAIARAMAHRPEIMFADEPTGALDTASGIYIAELFKKLTRDEGLTVVMTTHDLRLSELADMVVQL